MGREPMKIFLPPIARRATKSPNENSVDHTTVRAMKIPNLLKNTMVVLSRGRHASTEVIAAERMEIPISSKVSCTRLLRSFSEDSRHEFAKWIV
jgi:hypothetical protein